MFISEKNKQDAINILGWSIFPCHHIKNGNQCSCGNENCKSKGKHPTISNGVNGASNKLEDINAWWDIDPHANIAIATGKVSGIFVVDIDVANGKIGETSLAELENIYGKLPDTAMVITGSGGYHYYFKYPQGVEIPSNQNALGTHIDVRADGGYVIAPPSNHESGNWYEWEGSSDPFDGCEIADAPAWMLDLICKKQKPITGGVIIGGTSTEWESMCDEARGEFLSAMSFIENETRESWLKVGFAIHATDSTQIGFDRWCEWSKSSSKFDISDQARVWASFNNAKPEKRHKESIYFEARKNGYKSQSEQIKVEEVKEAGNAIVEEINNPKQNSSYNQILDDETPYSTIDLLKNLDDNQLIKRLSKTLSAGIQLPESTTFLMGLAIFSSVATRAYCVAYEYGGSIPIGLYAVAEQPPAAAKTWLQTEFQKPFNAIDDEKRKLRKEELARLEKQLDNCEDKVEKKELEKQIKELQKNPVPLLFVTNATPEALEMSLHGTNGFFSLVSSEQSLFDSLLGLYHGDTDRQNNNEVLLNGFDGSKSGTLRITREAYSGRAAGGVALFAQNGSIEKVLNASNGTGLSERFLMLSEPHFLGKRKHVEAPFIDRAITAEYDELAQDIARVALRQDREVSFLSISKNGHLEIKKYRDAIEKHLADGGKYAAHQSLRGAAGKSNMQIMKIAANLHLLDGGAYEPQIDDKHVISAINIVNDLLNASLGLCHDKELVGLKAEFNAIIKNLGNKQKTQRDIINCMNTTLPFKNLTSGKSQAIKNAIDEMVRQGLLVIDNLSNPNGIPYYKLAK